VPATGTQWPGGRPGQTGALITRRLASLAEDLKEGGWGGRAGACRRSENGAQNRCERERQNLVCSQRGSMAAEEERRRGDGGADDEDRDARDERYGECVLSGIRGADGRMRHRHGGGQGE
jgi:hypothetical protein